MGLDASVMCNCFEKGLTSEPPFPRDWLYVDEEGYLNLRKQYETDDRWSTLWAWEQNCCVHAGMDYCHQRISNWSGYRLFQAGLDDAGIELFPALEEELPNANGGRTEAKSAASCLRELATFRERTVIGKKTVLVDTVADVVIQEFIAVYAGVFTLASSEGVNLGLSEYEFFIRDTDTDHVVFSATRFRQSVHGEQPTGRPGESILYLNLDSGMSYETTVPVLGCQIPWEDGRLENDEGRNRYDYPLDLHVEQREKLTDDFDYVVTALEKVFRASVETGNPVRWC